MNLIRSFTSFAGLQKPTVATIGNFDGVHLGHQAMIDFVIQQAQAKNLQSALITFEPTPKEYFLKDKSPSRIYNFRAKYEVVRSLGIQHFVCLRFNKALASMPAKDFIEKVLVDQLRIQQLVVGDDFRFGWGREGNTALLKAMGEQYSYQVHDQETVLHATRRVSSSAIREKLAAGEFKQTLALMGRPFDLSGRVFHGDKRGRTIGFPTANILLKRSVSPLQGVFAIRASTFDKQWEGVANIGKRPTIKGSRMQLEAHLFNCDENLYGQRLNIQPLLKIRDEQKFSSLEELQHQISLDVEQAQHYFKHRT